MIKPLKFPGLYRNAAQLLKLASEEDKNVKDLLYNEKKYQHLSIKSLYAIVAKSLKYWDVIENLIDESNILKENGYLDIWRIRVLIAELIFNEKTFPNPENNTIQKVVQYEEKFKKILSKRQINGLTEPETNVNKVRFIKVNLIKEDVASVIERFQEEGWERLETASSYPDYSQQLQDLEPHSSVFLQDFHIPEVLVFPPGTELQSHELYANGSIFFMDKASCLAPLLLAPCSSGHVLDMCAAPGLKTIQLAGYVRAGKVYAVDRDAERFYSLQKMVGMSGAENVTVIHQDVTSLDVEQYQHVEYILVDPSCTGSGIRKRQPSGNVKTRVDEKSRLEKLAGFQLTLLRFALTRFPAAKRVVYSTCSLNEEENEQVVQAALRSLGHNFDVVSVQDKLPGWTNFGSSDFEFGQKCIYCRPKIDHTNGFFVAVFERNKMKSATSLANNEKAYFKGGKRRIQVEGYNNENYSLPISSYKRPKIEYDRQVKNKQSVGVATDSNNDQGIEKAKQNYKKLSLSEKKRSRKKRLKVKNKVLPQSSKLDKLKVKNKLGLNVIVEKKNKSSTEGCDKKVSVHHSEAKEKVSRAKLRHKRVKLLKSRLTSGINAKEINNLSKTLHTSETTKCNEDLPKLMKKKKNSSHKINVNASLEEENVPHVKRKVKKRNKDVEENISFDENEIEKVDTKKNKGKVLSVESTEAVRSEDNKDVLSATNEVNEDEDTSKKKRKKKHSTEHKKINIDKDLCVEEEQVRVENATDTLKSYDIGKVSKKKHKKNKSLDNNETNISDYVDKDLDRAIETDTSEITKSKDSEKRGKPEKRHKKKHLDQYENITTNYVDDSKDLNGACEIDVSNQIEIKDTVDKVKKRQKKISLDHEENEVLGIAEEKVKKKKQKKNIL